MHESDQPAEQPTTLPEFRIADPAAWLGDPDFDVVDLVLGMPEYFGANVWSPQGGEVEEVETRDDLKARVARLDDNRFGVLKCAVGERFPFAQTLRVGDAWIVEVHDGTADGWVSRVRRGERTMPQDVLDPAEAFTADDAATIMWAWLAGELPEGLSQMSLR
ncbi:hypothetical protein [Agrococcus sp. ARC_14]|uniref:hypothetical protein n=1 Tax=Agrococcus sp. ARC_14 TaxID=2919927 RepID=UPI001F05937B|nr:hypothetical protein [Agrococcus sp. ARC_14]MCH1883960.1 hypothetical protein [Agrococcus sp. ARC_14]